jgi:hypothetical protein
VLDGAIDDAGAADAGADGDVARRGGVGRGPPGLLADGGRPHVGVEGHRDTERRADRAGHVGVRPTGLRGGGDVAPRRRAGTEVDGPERADAHGVDRPSGGEERHRGGDGLGRVAGGDDSGGTEVVGPGADSTHPLCAARFNGAVSSSPPRCARLAPTRFARQSVLARHGAALRRHRTAPAGVAASLRSACSYSHRSTIRARSTRRRTAAPRTRSAGRIPSGP